MIRKPLSIAVASVLLCLAALIALTACGSPNDRPSGSHTADTDGHPLPSAPAAETDAPFYDPDRYVVIRSAEDLMAFNRAVNRDGYTFDGMTVIFLNDIDMGDYTWEPLDGSKLAGVTFDGQGHTLSRLRFADYEYRAESGSPDADLTDAEKGCGFVGVASENITFRNLTLSRAAVKAFDHSVGNFVGAIRGARVTFSSCASVDFTVSGWMDWFHRDPALGGHAIAMRLGGFVGHIGEGSQASFDNCRVEGLTLSGFHNLAGFVGYDESGLLDASCFTNCAVTKAHLTFSYCLAESYTADQPKKFVSVFFNSHDFADTSLPCVAAGNTYTEVYFYDWANDSRVYTPDQFLSHPDKEADHAP